MTSSVEFKCVQTPAWRSLSKSKDPANVTNTAPAVKNTAVRNTAVKNTASLVKYTAV